MSDFNALLNSDDPFIAMLANKAKSLRLRLLNGEITAAEFDELMADLQHGEIIGNSMSDLVLLKKINEIIDVLHSVKSWMP